MTRGLVKDVHKVVMDKFHFTGITSIDNLVEEYIDKHYHDSYTFNPLFIKHAIEALSKSNEKVKIILPKEMGPLILIGDNETEPAYLIAPEETEVGI